MAGKAVKRGLAPKRDKLTLRERRFIKFLAMGTMTQQEAAIAAGYSAKCASVIASENLTKPKIQKAFTEILESKGLTDDRIAETIANGIEANKVISAMVVRGGPDSIADEQDGMADAHSMTKDFVEVPDWMARHKFVDTTLKLKGKYPNEKVEIPGLSDLADVLNKALDRKAMATKRIAG